MDGEPTIDMLGVEPRRYGNYATKSYLKAKNEEAYSHVFIVHYPDAYISKTTQNITML